MSNYRIVSFVKDKISQVLVIEGTQGVGKTNLLNYFERELEESLSELGGYYIVRYLADPEASFDGILRRLFQALGTSHFAKLAQKLSEGENLRLVEIARGHEMRMALTKLSKSPADEDVLNLFFEWLLGLRIFNRHKDKLGVHFRLDTVESKTVAFRDLVFVSSAAGILNGIFLLLDELEKQDGVLSPVHVVRYLSALRAIIDALPSHLFMMLAVTPDAFRRYSTYLPALRGRLQDRIELAPLKEAKEAIELAHFYLQEATSRAEAARAVPKAPRAAVLGDKSIGQIFLVLHDAANKRGDPGVRQREFLHELYKEADKVIRQEAGR